MKILHIFHHADLLNGVDRTTLTLARALQRKGARVSALVPHEGNVTQALADSGIPYRVADLACCGSSAKQAELRYLALAAERAHMIAAWLGQEGFDLVHLNTGHLIDGALAAAISGVPAVWHIHAPFEIDLARYNFAQPQAYAWLLSSLGSHVIAVSDDVRESLLHHMPGNRVSTLFNGIDTEGLRQNALSARPDLRKDLGLAPGTPIVLGVGRISEQKDFATFVRVAELVTKQDASVCFAIAGPAEDQALASALATQISASGLSRRVFLLGPRNDVPGLLAESDAFLSTAIFEGQGLAALEAMALGKPVIAMDCVGLRECIRHEIDGILTPLGNEPRCAEAVLRVLQTPDWSGGLASQGRQTVETRFSASAYAQGFLDIATRVLGAPCSVENTGAAHLILGLLDEIQFAHNRELDLASDSQGLSGKLCRGLSQMGILARLKGTRP